MKMRGEGFVPWVAGGLPPVAVVSSIAALPYFFPEAWSGTDLFDGKEGWQPLLLVLVAAALAGASAAYWISTVLNRYREQVRLRENALREFNTTLEMQVEEELDRRRRQDRVLLQRSTMTAMDDTVGMIAHRWKKPLEQLSEMLGGTGETKARTIVASMRQTLEEFEDFFHPDSAREAVNLSESIRQTLGLLGEDLSSHRIDVETQLECSMTLPLLRNEVIRVLISVIQNARDALVQRRIELPRIEIECYETGQFIVIRICDNGGGVDAGIEDRIFEPYFSTKEQTRASGLGLYMARNIVEEHFNGELTFDNLGEGACFYLKFGKHQEGADT
jgi:two-component system C4-dicarboxylate transport sensor histidine kinase DctB